MGIPLHLSVQTFQIPLSVNPEKNMLIACCRNQAEQAAAFEGFSQLQVIAERLECDWVAIRLGVKLTHLHQLQPSHSLVAQTYTDPVAAAKAAKAYWERREDKAIVILVSNSTAAGVFFSWPGL